MVVEIVIDDDHRILPVSDVARRETAIDEGVVVMGIDNLPCELPRESSHAFSNALHNLAPEIAKADFSQDFDNCKLPPAIKKAVVLYHGKLTPDYQYIDKYL